MLLALWDVLGGTGCSKVSSIRPCNSVTMSFHFLKKNRYKEKCSISVFYKLSFLKMVGIVCYQYSFGFYRLNLRIL